MIEALRAFVYPALGPKSKLPASRAIVDDVVSETAG